MQVNVLHHCHSGALFDHGTSGNRENMNNDATSGNRGLRRLARLLPQAWKMIGLITLVAGLAGMSGCHRAETPASLPAGAKVYQVKGKVRGFGADTTTLTIEHEDIPGFMPSMTMPFTTREPVRRELFGIGDAVAFRLVVGESDSWIDQLRKIDPAEVHLPEPAAAPELTGTGGRLKEGDAMPDFDLTNQGGTPIHKATFLGHPFVLTFVFTRCPLPSFCPLMSRNFDKLQDAIKAPGSPIASTHLLSITLDPRFDTPAILKQYGDYHHADSAIWALATGEPAQVDTLTARFSVYRKEEGGTITHTLCTALVNSEGVITNIWRGNSWTPEEVIAAISALKNQ